MSDDRKKQLSKDMVTTAVNTAAAVGATLVSGGSPEQALIRGGFVVGAGLVNAIRGFFGKQNQKMLTGYSPDESEQEAADRLEDAMSRNPDNAQTIVGILKNVEETIDPEALPILGKLLRSYTDADRPFDAFVRGFARLLRDLDRGEVAQLQRLVLELKRHADEHVMLLQGIGGPGAVTIAASVEESDVIEVLEYGRKQLSEMSASRLVSAFLKNDLGVSIPRVDAPPGARIPFPLVNRLAEFLSEQ